jgi:CheY-like chemotaxis protein
MNKTILCIDDSQLLLMVYKQMLTNYGYKAILASSGSEGLDILKHRAIDCVILDYHMPRMDGSAVIRCMRQLRNPPPIILVSGSDPPPEIIEQVEAFVGKTDLVPQLLESIDSVIGDREKHPKEPAPQQLGA